MPENRTISHYEVVGEAGRGGMATVFVARDTRIDRQVVIKVLPGYFLHDQQFRGRFLQEAKVLVTLSHPNIVPVYEFGEEGDQPYLVMRYMSGGTLGERIEQGPIPLDEAIEILKPIASALDYAHGKGIVHRDMKPANILFDESGAAYLADFGIVKLAEATRSFTGSAIIGTPAYMSPEQVQGGKQIDGRSDVYSLGVILYEMLAGEVPYKGDTPTQQLMKHVLEPAPAIRQVRSDIPPAIEAVLLQALAKDPANRYPTATAFLTALAEAQSGKPQATYYGTMLATGEMLSAAAATASPQPQATEVHSFEYEPLPGMKRGRSMGKLATGVIMALMLLLIAGGAAAWYMGMIPGQAPVEPTATTEGLPVANVESERATEAALGTAEAVKAKGTAAAELDVTQIAEAVVKQTEQARAAQEGDDDGDGLSNADEKEFGTNPKRSDSDNDGLDDWTEVNGPTDPLNPDSDNDGLNDGQETDFYGTDPLNADTDSDRLSDGDEVEEYKTDPKVRDMDGDGMSDGDEIAAGSDPRQAHTPTPDLDSTRKAESLALTSTAEALAIFARAEANASVTRDAELAITRTAEAKAAAAPYCPGALPTRLAVGAEAHVISGQVNARSGPGTDFPINDRLAKGRQLSILDGPECDNEGQLWYYVRSEPIADSSGGTFRVEGWVVEESGGSYFMEPSR